MPKLQLYDMALAKKKVIYCTGHGSYLGVLHSKQSFRLVKNDDSVEELPFCRCSSIYVTDGNTVSSNALFIAGMYNIPVLVLSQTGRIISTLRSVESDNDVEYDAYRKAKGVRIAKEILLAKVQTQLSFLKSTVLTQPRYIRILTGSRASRPRISQKHEDCS